MAVLMLLNDSLFNKSYSFCQCVCLSILKLILLTYLLSLAVGPVPRSRISDDILHSEVTKDL